MVAIGWVVGLTPWASAIWPLGLVMALSAPALALRHREPGVLLGMSGLAAAVAGALVHATPGPETVGTAAPSSAVRLIGTIVALERDASPGARAALRLDVALEPRGRAPAAPEGPQERIRVWVGRSDDVWRVGERIEFVARPRPGRGRCNGGIDGFARMLARERIEATAWVRDGRVIERIGVGSTVGFFAGAIAGTRSRIGTAIDAATSPSESGVLKALVIGERAGISPDLQAAYTRSGAVHLLSVSGFHLVIVAGGAYVLLRTLLVRWPSLATRTSSTRWAAALSIVPAVAYSALTGWAAPTVRALVMAVLQLAGMALGRRTRVEVSLAAGAIVVALEDPRAPLDPSVQLSFAAVVGIVAGTSRLAGLVRTRRVAPPLVWRIGKHVGSAALCSILAEVATAAITAHHFGTVTLVGVLTNLLVAPLVGTAALAIALVSAGFLAVAPPVATAGFTLAGWCVQLGNQVVEALASLPWAALEVSRPSALLTLGLLSMVAALALSPGRLRTGVFLLAAALLGCARMSPWLREDLFRVEFLDVGHGDAAILDLPGTSDAIVVDGGPAQRIDVGRRILLPALAASGSSSVGAMLLSHPQADHYGGLTTVLEQWPVKELWSSGRRGTGPMFVRFERNVRDADVLGRALAAGDAPRIERATIEMAVLHPPRDWRTRDVRGENDASLVVAFAYGATRVLFTGDIEAAAERTILRTGLDVSADILKVPHHGSRTSSTEPFVTTVGASLAVVSSAPDAPAFPASAVAARYARSGAKLLGTGIWGAIEVASDGQLTRVATCRNLGPGT